jgi:cytochrome c oxidase cbb3-type subunit I/II
MVKSNIPTIASVKPYSPLELEGRDLYIREGCVGCHSQSVRPFRSEVERYGPQSKAGNLFMTIHFFGDQTYRFRVCKYNDNWHFNHLNPKYICRIYYARLQMVV